MTKATRKTAAMGKSEAASAPPPIATMVPLIDLYIHPLNTRSDPPAEDITALAESIRAIGLLQNLMGYTDATGQGTIGIVAGGRRLRAIRLLHDAGLMGDDPYVPVLLTDNPDTARIWASAENTARTALHPADEIRAYGRMADQGADPATIAKAFAVTERHVRQRLRLARLPDQVIAALRRDGITLDQAAALTTAPSEEAALAQLARVDGKSGWGLDAASIRDALAKSVYSATDRLAIFVGLDRYRAAGGRVQEDLFTDRILLLDGALLDDLFRARLDECVALQSVRPWKWVQPHLDYYLPYTITEGLERIRRTPIDLPDADAAELDDLESRANDEQQLTDAEIDRMQVLEDRRDGDYAEADITTSGVFLYVDRAGQLVVSDPFRHPQDNPAQQATADETTQAEKPEPKALPESLRTDLARIRLAALQVELMDAPDLLLDLLAFGVQANLTYDVPLEVRFTRATIAPEKPEGTALPKRLTAADDAAPTHGRGTAEAFIAWRNQGQIARDRAISLHLARAFRGGELGPLIASLTDPDPRKIWTPTAAGYLSRLPCHALDGIWVDLVPDDRTPNHATFRALKKAEKAQHLHRLFNDTDFREVLGLSRAQNTAIDTWLPAELQWPAVEPAAEPPAPETP